MSKRKKGGVRLTKATAKKLIGRVARGAEIEDECNRNLGADIYEACVDGLDLVVKCENDWSARNRRINLTISDRWGGGHITICLDPETLERDLVAEDELRKEDKEERK